MIFESADEIHRNLPKEGQSIELWRKSAFHPGAAASEAWTVDG